MKFEVTASFQGDWGRLSDRERKRFREVLPDFNGACDRIAADPSVGFPGSLRLRDVENAPGVLEMTWSFAGPDGRATFEWATIEGRRAVRWRRISGHAVFRRP